MHVFADIAFIVNFLKYTFEKKNNPCAINFEKSKKKQLQRKSRNPFFPLSRRKNWSESFRLTMRTSLMWNLAFSTLRTFGSNVILSFPHYKSSCCICQLSIKKGSDIQGVQQVQLNGGLLFWLQFHKKIIVNWTFDLPNFMKSLYFKQTNVFEHINLGREKS